MVSFSMLRRLQYTTCPSAARSIPTNTLPTCHGRPPSTRGMIRKCVLLIDEGPARREYHPLHVAAYLLLDLVLYAGEIESEFPLVVATARRVVAIEPLRPQARG
jgi:hypothetical protein